METRWVGVSLQVWEQPGLGLRVDLGATLWVDLERSTQVLTGV